MSRRFDVSIYRGLARFGPAYRVMLENDAHAEGSVDRVLMENMVRLCTETADYLYSEYTPARSLYRRGERPELECWIDRILLACTADEERVEAIVRFTAGLQGRACQELTRSK